MLARDIRAAYPWRRRRWPAWSVRGPGGAWGWLRPIRPTGESRVARRARIGSGHPIALEAYDLEVYQLACCFAGSRELARLARADRMVEWLRLTFQESEASRRLVAVAAIIRTSLDTWVADAERVGRLPVGSLAEAGTTCVLSFREACNKVLHADEVELYRNHKQKALSKNVVLYGSRTTRTGDRKWKATLDINAFIAAAAKVH